MHLFVLYRCTFLLVLTVVISAEDCELIPGKTCPCSSVTIESIVKWDINCTGLTLGPMLQRIHPQLGGQQIKVKSLDLTECDVETIAVGAFNDTNEIEVLHLENNKLSVLPESLAVLNDLQILNIAENSITYIPDTILSDKSKLLRLSLKDNVVIDIPDNAFPGGLEELDLSGNLLEFVPTKALSTLSSLKVLSLASNNILEIGEGDFKGMSSLRQLTLSDNQIYHISQNLSISSLTSLNLNNNKLKYLDPCLKAGLPSLDVGGLRASNNPWLCTCDMLWINGTAKLDDDQYICNSRLFNEYSLGAFFYEDCYDTIVGECSLSVDHIVNCDECDCDAEPGVMDCDVGIGPVLKVVDPGDYEITKLILSADSLYEIDDHAFDKIQDTLESFTLTYSSLGYIPSAINSLANLKYLELSDNRISVLQSFAFVSLKLEHLILSSNEITKISDLGFVGTGESLSTLNLDGNLMTSLPVESFKWLINLQEFHQALNSIVSVPSKAFSSSKALESIDISENQITFVANDAFEGLDRVRSILLYQNKISALDLCTFSNLTSLETLDASDNPYYCTCDIAWLTNYDKDNFIAYVCDGPDELKDEVILDYVGANCSDAVNRTCDAVVVSPVNCDICRCNQTQNGWLIDCSDSDIGPVVDSIQRELIISQLILSRNNIAVLTSGSLIGIEAYIEKLHLDNNQFKAIPTAVQELTSLTFLNMAQNSIDAVEDDFFLGLSSLEVIDLSHNLISFLDFAFEGLGGSLKMLDLSHNKLLEVPSFSLAKLNNLESLQISWNSIQTLREDAFKGLDSLASLDISVNEISYISNYAFTGVSGSLRHINITGNALLDIDFCAFNNFTNLTDISADGNPLYCTCNLAWLESSLTDKDTTLCFYPNEIKNQTLVDFLDERCPAEKDKEKIEEITPADDQCNRTANGVADCEVCSCTAETTFYQVMTCSDRFQAPFLSVILTGEFAINVLDLSINSISILGENSFSEISESVHTIDMSHNELKAIPNALEKAENLQELDLSKNFVTMLERGVFDNYQKIRILKFSRNNISFIDPEFVLFPNSIEDLDLAWNKLNSLTFLRNLLSVTSLKLEYNNIKYINQESFKDLTQITFIDLTGNNIKYIHPKAFTDLENSLETLLLSSNDLESISPCPFEGITSLTSLNMTQNPLKCHCDLNWLDKWVDPSNPNDACLSQDSNKLTRLAEYFDADCKDDAKFECKDTKDGSASCDVCSCNSDDPPLLSMACPMNSIGTTLYDVETANLTSILISGTKLQEIKSNVFIFSEETLKDLDFSNNSIDMIPTLYLPTLYTFRISDNSIIIIKNNTFRYLHTVETIDVSNNNITEIEPMAFNGTNSLKELILNGNDMTILPTKAFRVLSTTRTLRLTNNKIRTIPENAFSEMKSLQTLYLDGNEISYIHRQAFHVVNGSLLNYIKLEENRLITATSCTFNRLVEANARVWLYSNTFHCSCDLNWMKNIDMGVFDEKYTCSTPPTAEGMRISEFIQQCKVSDGTCDPNERDHSVLDCDECSCTGNKMICSGKREVVQMITKREVARFILSDNDIAIFSQNAFDLVRESVTMVTLDRNDLTSIPTSFADMPNLVSVSFIGNNITKIPAHVFLKSQNLNNVDLQNNNLENIHVDAFDGIEDNLLTLNIANNSFENIPMVLKNLTSLKFLDMSNNKLFELGDDTFKGMVGLNTLVLDGNLITNISNGAFNGLSSLQVLHLTRNMIKTIHVESFEKLNLKSVFLFDNPLECSCSIRWIEEFDKTNIDKYTCKSTTDDEILLVEQFDKCDKGEACKLESKLFANCSTCQCSESANEMYCSRVELGPVLCNVETPVYDILSLYLAEAEILTITNGSFTSLKETLTVLDLSKNKMTSVPSEIRVLTKLQELILNNNKIDIVDAMAFVDLKQLEVVDLRFNMIQEVYAGAFVGTDALLEVDFQFNNLTVMPTEAFSDLVHVKRLKLGNNAIKMLPSAGFQAMVALESLFLENNNISYIHRNAFDGVDGILTYLRLNGNNLVTADSCAFSKLVEANAGITIYQNKFHCSCSLNWMKRINLEANADDYTCTTPPNVKGMTLNKFLERCESSEGVCDPTERDHTVLDCEECSCEKDEMICTGIREVIQITTRTDITKLTLTNNSIVVFSQNALDSVRGSLKYVKLDQNYLTSIPPSLSNMPFLVNASFIGNNISRIAKDTFVESKMLENIDLQNNILEFIHDDAFNGITEVLVTLNIDANSLVEIPLAVTKLSKLHILDVSSNKIGQIGNDAFNGMDSLRTLELDGNLITNVSKSAFDGLKNIQTIYLQNNKISTIQADVFSTLDLQTLYIYGNPFECSCDLLWLDVYIKTNKDQYTCASSTVEYFPITNQFGHCRKLNECRKDNKKIADCQSCTCDKVTNKMDCSNEDFGTSLCSVDPPAYEINYLDLTNIGVSEISKDALSYVGMSLQEIKLSDNQFTAIDLEIRQLKNIKRIQLDNNLIEAINEYELSNLTRLEYIDFGNNSISEIDSNAFSGTINLTEINIFGNMLPNIPTGVLSKLAYLRILRLSKNMIKMLPEKAFQDVTSLTQLFLDENEIVYIHKDAFVGVKDSLKLLKIDGNKLLTSAPCVFDSFSNTSISLLDNPIYCSCGLKWMTRVNINMNDDKYVCTGPASYMNTSIREFLNTCPEKDGVCNPIKPDGGVIDCTACSCTGEEIKCNSLDNIVQIATKPTNITISKLVLTGNGIEAMSSSVFEQFKNDLVQLFLDNNVLTEVPKAIKSLAKLDTLALGHNKLSTLKENDFDGLDKLETLYIQNNSIGVIEEGTFNNLKLLGTLDLEANSLENVPKEALKSLSSLTIINLDNNKISNITGGLFESMTNLRELKLRGNTVTSVSSDAFKGLNEVTLIDLGENEISFIDACAVKDLTSLSRLILEGNPIHCSCAWSWSQDKIDLDASYVCKTPSLFDNVTLGDYLGQNCGTRRAVCGDYGETKPDCSSCVCSTGSKTFTCSRVKLGPYLNQIEAVGQISDLTIAEASIVGVDEDAFILHKSTLKTLKLTSSQLSSIPVAIKQLTILEDLDLTANVITSIAAYAFSGMMSLKSIVLSENRISSLSTNAFSVTSSKKRQAPVLTIENVKLNGNNLTTIPTEAFNDLINIKTLDLSNNQISKIPADAFIGMINLEELDISGNKIDSISRDAFRGLPKLSTLKLGDNQLTILDACPFNISTLAILELSGNQFNCFDCSLASLEKWFSNCSACFCASPVSKQGTTVSTYIKEDCANTTSTNDCKDDTVVTTQTPDPEEPLKIAITLTEGGINITWSILGLSNIDGFKVTHKGSMDDKITSPVFHKDTREYTIINTKPGTEYDVCVIAMVSNSNVTYTACDSITTNPGVKPDNPGLSEPSIIGLIISGVIVVIILIVIIAICCRRAKRKEKLIKKVSSRSKENVKKFSNPTYDVTQGPGVTLPRYMPQPSDENL